MEQPFEDAGKAMYRELVYGVMEATMMMMMMMMSAFFSDPKVAASLSEQQLDWACPAFKWNLLAMTICYNHVDALTLSSTQATNPTTEVHSTWRHQSDP